MSVVLVTKNEAANLEDAVASLLAQAARLEVLIVDGASTDGTPEIARRLEARHAGRIRLVASRPLPVGPARNLGLEAARGRVIAFMSADATAAPGWARALLSALRDADIAYGRQEHTPPRISVAAVVRGLRYHHFRRGGRAPPETYASNVNAAIRGEVFDQLRYVDEGPASALDDILFTHEAKAAGLRIAYAPDALVHHKDATTLRAEARKNRREGYGWGILSPQLGVHRPIVLWGTALLLAILLASIRPAAWSLILLAAVLWAPTLRRAALGTAAYLKRPDAVFGAVLVGPFFDLLFLVSYAGGLLSRRGHLTGRQAQGTRSP